MLNQKVPMSWMPAAAHARSVGCQAHSFPSVVCRYWSSAALVKNREPTKNTVTTRFGATALAKGWKAPRAKQAEPTMNRASIHQACPRWGGVLIVGHRTRNRRRARMGAPPVVAWVQTSAAMSRPWAVRAQITLTAMAIRIELHTGWMGR